VLPNITINIYNLPYFLYFSLKAVYI